MVAFLLALQDFTVELTSPTKLFDGQHSWCQPRAGTIPGEKPAVVLTLQRVQLSGSDVFDGLKMMRTDDLGRTWSGPTEIPGFERRPYEGRYEITVCDFTPRWHAASGKLLGTGQTAVYLNNRLPEVRPRHVAYAAYDPASKAWSAWAPLKLPDDPNFGSAGAGSTQRFDLENGDILLPIYFKRPDTKQYSTSVLRCRFDGETLSYVEHGGELTLPIDRGLYEPSITRVAGRFYLTMRNDKAGYVATSADGLRFDEPRKWTWDDGTDLGTYNTQQHWVTRGEGLFLVYTRKGANNDHVFRHRAPLFIARVDREKLHVIRATERELMPNRGARLGNFAVTDVGPDQTWVTDAEWMQPKGVERHGADGSVWVSKIRWKD